ncbi:high frequency lysogenization protein HflD [Orbaceae bacterium ac157xtp]
MNNKYHHIAIALAGICQNISIVPKIANDGYCNNHLYDIAIKSIFNTSPSSTEDVYGGIENLKIGLTLLIELFSASNTKMNTDVIRYTFGALGLANRLSKKPEALEKIAQRLTRIQSLYDEVNSQTLETNRDEISYSLGGIYTDIISPIATKIRVTGRVEYLQNTLAQAQVRTALFAGVRSAILWKQVGGNRLQLIFSRAKIIKAAKELLQQSA